MLNLHFEYLCRKIHKYQSKRRLNPASLSAAGGCGSGYGSSGSGGRAQLGQRLTVTANLATPSTTTTKTTSTTAGLTGVSGAGNGSTSGSPPPPAPVGLRHPPAANDSP